MVEHQISKKETKEVGANNRGRGEGGWERRIITTRDTGEQRWLDNLNTVVGGLTTNWASQEQE